MMIKRRLVVVQKWEAFFKKALEQGTLHSEKTLMKIFSTYLFHSAGLSVRDSAEILVIEEAEVLAYLKTGKSIRMRGMIDEKS